jgi:hypothetical protein
MAVIERIMLPDVDAYDHPLWHGAAAAIARIAAGETTPDEYQADIAALFDRISPVEALAEWTARCLAEETDQLLQRRMTPTHSVWFQLLYMGPSEAHPPHGHRDLISNQVLLHGRTYLREYDRVQRLDDRTVLLKQRSDHWMEVGDRIRTTEVDRNVHWFGSDGRPSVQLNFFITGYQKWTFDAAPERRGRTYYDPTGEVTADGMIVGHEIPGDEAHQRFQRRLITDFPVRRPQRIAA